MKDQSPSSIARGKDPSLSMGKICCEYYRPKLQPPAHPQRLMLVSSFLKDAQSSSRTSSCSPTRMMLPLPNSLPTAVIQKRHGGDFTEDYVEVVQLAMDRQLRRHQREQEEQQLKEQGTVSTGGHSRTKSCSEPSQRINVSYTSEQIQKNIKSSQLVRNGPSQADLNNINLFCSQGQKIRASKHKQVYHRRAGSLSTFGQSRISSTTNLLQETKNGSVEVHCLSPEGLNVAKGPDGYPSDEEKRRGYTQVPRVTRLQKRGCSSRDEQRIHPSVPCRSVDELPLPISPQKTRSESWKFTFSNKNREGHECPSDEEVEQELVKINCQSPPKMNIPLQVHAGDPRSELEGHGNDRKGYHTPPRIVEVTKSLSSGPSPDSSATTAETSYTSSDDEDSSVGWGIPSIPTPNASFWKRMLFACQVDDNVFDHNLEDEEEDEECAIVEMADEACRDDPTHLRNYEGGSRNYRGDRRKRKVA